MTAWWVVVLCFLLSMGCCFVLVFVVYKAYRFVKGLFFPSIQLPTHFREVRTLSRVHELQAADPGCWSAPPSTCATHLAPTCPASWPWTQIQSRCVTRSSSAHSQKVTILQLKW